MSEDKSYRNSFGLTKKQEAFAQAVITEDNLSNAYRMAYECAGMTDKTVNEKASIEAKKDKVRARITELRDRAEKAADVSLDRWLREQARIAYVTAKDIYNDDGSLKPISEMTDDAAAAIAGIDTETRREGEDEEAVVVTIRKVKLHSKTAAQDSIGRALGAYEKDNRQRGDIIPNLANKPDWIGDDGAASEA